jgi:hypothetical protein
MQAEWRLPPNAFAGGCPSPLQRMLGQEEMRRYRPALRRLKPRGRLLIVLRVEQRLSFREITAHLQMPSPNAAGIASVRATERFVSALKHV